MRYIAPLRGSRDSAHCGGGEGKGGSRERIEYTCNNWCLWGGYERVRTLGSSTGARQANVGRRDARGIEQAEIGVPARNCLTRIVST